MVEKSWICTQNQITTLEVIQIHGSTTVTVCVNSLQRKSELCPRRAYLAIDAKYPVVAAREPDDEEDAEYHL